MFPRSVNKPMQAAALLRAGLDLDGKLLALAAASHSGEDFHVAGVREILARAGLTESALRCPPALPHGRARPARGAAPRRRPGPGAHELLREARGHAGLLRVGGLAGRPATSIRPTRCRPRSGARWRSWPASGCRRSAWTAAAPRCSRCPSPGWPGRCACWSPRRRHPGAPGGRRDARLSGLDLGQPPPGAGADGRGARPAGQVRRRGRGGARAGRWPGRRVQDRGRRVAGPPAR